MGAVAYITKPFDPGELRGAVRRIVESMPGSRTCPE